LSGWRRGIYSNSLLIMMAVIWVASWAVQSVTGHAAYNAEQFDHQEASLTWVQYIGTSDFWTGHCRTGSRSSSPWARWPSCPSTCANEDLPSPSRSAPHTTPRASKARAAGGAATAEPGAGRGGPCAYIGEATRTGSCRDAFISNGHARTPPGHREASSTWPTPSPAFAHPTGLAADTETV
jgi:hypothetical protein